MRNGESPLHPIHYPLTHSYTHQHTLHLRAARTHSLPHPLSVHSCDHYRQRQPPYYPALPPLTANYYSICVRTFARATRSIHPSSAETIIDFHSPPINRRLCWLSLLSAPPPTQPQLSCRPSLVNSHSPAVTLPPSIPPSIPPSSPPEFRFHSPRR